MMQMFLEHLLAIANVSWFLAFCELWLIGCVTGVVFKLLNRILRTIKVAIAGWPPEHLDADGDWKPEPETN